MFSSEIELPLIDISIVTYNSSRWINNFFKSLINQKYPLSKINIFIIDNSSTDNTIDICQNIKDYQSASFNDFQIFTRPNLGFGSGHNYSLAQGNAPYFLVSNVDLEFSTNSIYEAVVTAKQDSEIVASWEFRQKPYEHPKYYDPITLETAWSSHACILFRRSAIETVRGYEEKIFLYGEDVELSYRLRDHGFILKYCPKAVCWHYSYETAGQIKACQFFGSTLANSYLRLRYGSLKDVASIPLMYASLWCLPPLIEGKLQGLLYNGCTLIQNALYFIRTRKTSKTTFQFKSWDYGLTREGAFYEHKQETVENKPLVSVIIRTYQGRLGYLQEAISSVLNQTYTRIELIVIEDGSETSKFYIEQIAQKQFLEKVFYQPTLKRGRCHAGNVGLACSTGDFIVFLDDDDLFFADHIEVLVDELIAHPEIAAVYSLAWQVETKVLSLDPLIYEEMSHQSLCRQPFSKVLIWQENYIPIQAILFRRGLYEKYGGFDEKLENLEDWDLWIRYSLHHDFLLIDKTTSIYRIPYALDQKIKRQDILDSYYQVIVKKQKALSLIVSPSQITDFHQQLTAYEKRAKSLTAKLKKNIRSNRNLRAFYYMFISAKRFFFKLF